MIPTCDPLITPEDIEAVQLALRRGHAALGPEVEEFEQAVAKTVGRRYAVATSSGSAALHVALLALGPAFSYRVPALTFIATAEAVIHAGAQLEIVDHDRPADIVVNFYGHPPTHPGTIEDACEGLGSTIEGAIACLSFNGNKIITCGAGGMALTDYEDMADRMRALVTHNRLPGIEYKHAGAGFNYRMPAMNAALGLSQLARLDACVARKREIAARYESLGVSLLKCAPGATSTFWMPVGLLAGDAAPVIERLQAQGIGARAVWYPLHKQPSLATGQSLPVAEDLHRRGIILPCSLAITASEQEQVVRAVAETGTPWQPSAS